RTGMIHAGSNTVATSLYVASQRARWSHRRRLALALALLRDPALDALITDSGPFADLPAVLQRLAAGSPGTLCHRIDYS
ncbi:MAG: hypothetical protein WKG52_01835, partial [Variovorax sp.]